MKENLVISTEKYIVAVDWAKGKDITVLNLAEKTHLGTMVLGQFVDSNLLAEKDRTIAELTAQFENSVPLPCKVGDTVWKIIIEFAKDGSTKPIGIKSGIVSMFQQLKNGQWKFRISKECDDYVSEFGKIYFITEAEAEARLKELEVQNEKRNII